MNMKGKGVVNGEKMQGGQARTLLQPGTSSLSSSILALIFSRLAWMGFLFDLEWRKGEQLFDETGEERGWANNQVISGESDPLERVERRRHRVLITQSLA